jgi:lipopolysaccharide transport system ATP-binding protein
MIVEELKQQNLTPSAPDDSDLLVSVDNLGKKFCRNLKKSLMYGVRDIAAELIGTGRKSEVLRDGEFWALQGIDFQLRRGEALGLVGANGAGKSTLLRIISGLIHPDTGSVKIRGRVAPLIALGAGFNPILTGRENIYANMSILGLPTPEIEERFDEVVDFAEISDAIDAPVQTYSSGMAARLGFACAAYINPDILLIDEVLAVGDVKFKIKCHRRLAELREQGTAFILVSHNSHSLLNVCDRSIYLKKGQLMTSGETESVIRQYEEDLCLSGTDKATGAMILPQKPAHESMGLDITQVCFKDESGHILEVLGCGEPAYLSVECQASGYFDNANLGFLVTGLGGDREYVLYLTTASDNEVLEISPGRVEIQMHLPHCGLVPGAYSAKIYIRTGVKSLDIIESFRFTVTSSKVSSRCLFYQPRTWKVVTTPE